MAVCWRKPRFLAGLVAVLGLLWVGVAGVGGLLLRQQLSALQHSPLHLDNGAQLSVEALHGGWFSTQTVLRLDWPQVAERTLVARLAADISHGPFPSQRLADFDFRPGALSGQLQLLSLDQLQGAQAQKLPAQFAGDLRVSYLGTVQASLQADIPDLPLGVWQLTLQRLQLDIEAAVLHSAGKLSLAAEQLEVRQGGAPLLCLNGLDQQGQLARGAVGSSLTLQAQVQQLALWAQPIGQLRQNVQAEGVDLAALMQALAGETSAWAEALPQASQIQGALFELANTDGNSALRLHKDTGAQSLLVTAQLSRPMFLASLESNAVLQRQGPAIARQQALKLYALVSQPLLQTGLFLADEQGLSMALEVDADGVRSRLPTSFLSSTD